MPLALQIILLGLILFLFRKTRSGLFFVFAGIVFLCAISIEPVADSLLRPLEQKYQPLQHNTELKPAYVVILGGGHFFDEELPPNIMLGSSSLSRLVEGLRIKNMYPDSLLLFTGGKFRYPVASSELSAMTAVQSGVDARDIIVLSEAMDTEDEAAMVKEVVGDETFVLITSAAHMHRAMLIFRYEGMNPVPSPTDFMAPEKLYNPWDYFPSSSALAKTERVFYERLGLAWAMLRGKVPVEQSSYTGFE